MVRQLYRADEFTVRELAAMFKVSRMAVWRYIHGDRRGVEE